MKNLRNTFKSAVIYIIKMEGYDFLNDWKIDHIDGTGRHRNNIFDILCNIILVNCSFRSAFLIQYVDYDESCRNSIVPKIIKNIKSLKYHNNPMFQLNDIDQGLLVFKSKFVAPELNALILRAIKLYNRKNDDMHNILGQLLGYPCAGDIDIPIGAKNRKGILLMVGDGCIMPNVCDASRLEFAHQKMSEMKKFLDGMREIDNVIDKLPEIYIIYL